MKTFHYRFDVDAGEEIGRKIAAVAVARHADMLARWTAGPGRWLPDTGVNLYDGTGGTRILHLQASEVEAGPCDRPRAIRN